jgi:hypothetical protein
MACRTERLRPRLGDARRKGAERGMRERELIAVDDLGKGGFAKIPLSTSLERYALLKPQIRHDDVKSARSRTMERGLVVESEETEFSQG